MQTAKPAGEGRTGGVLVVEDDRTVAASLARGLKEAGFAVEVVRSVEQARREMAAAAPGLVVLDLGLPDGDGLTLLKEWRRAGLGTPVIILTARETVNDRVSGLDQGADDYLVKPFSFAELLARIRARLRERRPAAAEGALRLADLEVDRLNRVVRRAGQAVELTAREFELLAYLVAAAGTPVTREMLAREVWRVNSRLTPLDNVIDVHISHLRDKVDRDHALRLIHTVRGVGFMAAEELP